MKRWIVYYRINNGFDTRVHTDANSRAEAVANIQAKHPGAVAMQVYEVKLPIQASHASPMTKKRM